MKTVLILRTDLEDDQLAALLAAFKTMAIAVDDNASLFVFDSERPVAVA